LKRRSEKKDFVNAPPTRTREVHRSDGAPRDLENGEKERDSGGESKKVKLLQGKGLLALKSGAGKRG